MFNILNKKRSRLVVRRGDEYITLRVEDIPLIYRNEMIIIAFDASCKKYLCDKNLSELESELDQSMFFRANRQYLVNIDFIRSFKTFEKVKLQVFLTVPHIDHQIIISQKTTPLFKKWISEE